MALCNRYTARLIFQHRCLSKTVQFFSSTTVKIRCLLKSVRAREQNKLCYVNFYFLTVYHQSTVYHSVTVRNIIYYYIYLI